jgi:MazG family protein
MDLNRLSRAVAALVELVARLRGPGGCAWDAKQTDSTIKEYLLEEAYEVLEAVDKGVPADLCYELGDLLFQILFLSRLAEERKDFDFVEVVEKITEKMVRRHPHVFGSVRVSDADEVARNWARIKEAEKGTAQSCSSMHSVPANLPALLRAHRLTERAAKAGFDFVGRDGVSEKMQRHLQRLRYALRDGEGERIGREIGEVLFILVNLARREGLNAEDLLRRRNRTFLERFEKMERELEQSGTSLEKASPEQIRRAWEEMDN